MTGKHQEIRFCKAPDGARIAVATMGKGPPLLRATHWLSHVEFDGRSPVWAHWLQRTVARAYLHPLRPARLRPVRLGAAVGLAGGLGRRSRSRGRRARPETVRSPRHVAGRCDRDFLRRPPPRKGLPPGPPRRLRPGPSAAGLRARRTGKKPKCSSSWSAPAGGETIPPFDSSSRPNSFPAERKSNTSGSTSSSASRPRRRMPPRSSRRPTTSTLRAWPSQIAGADPGVPRPQRCPRALRGRSAARRLDSGRALRPPGKPQPRAPRYRARLVAVSDRGAGVSRSARPAIG